MRRARRHSLLYATYLRSPLWRLRRRIWIVKAHGRCERCGSRRRLTIHHRTYVRLGRERRRDVSVLCWDCHRGHHAGRAPRYSRALALLTLIALPALLLATTLALHR